ncbi:HNH endonuclease [uncultured Arcobacter sp.]|uniref:HNH endonuclease signature motif containing protein n=1 Tax=uncultured Arcobacter sp. TaxID=165434 RepID=UPI002639C290|nr:HNH endonuclease [uncultured Arcobacter sp.]
MNYKNMYTQIINLAKNKNRSKNDGYFENHHIVPKSLGGDNNPSNLVLLTAKEHFICHHLLTKIYPNNNKLKFAFWAMCNQTHGDVKRTYKITSTVYEQSKIEFAKANSKNRKGVSVMTKERRQIQSINWKNNNPHKAGKESHLYNTPRNKSIKNKISTTKINNPERNAQYKGDWITPFGIFKSANQASKSCGIIVDTIRKRCNNASKIITKRMISNTYDLNESHIGKTFKELGWDFQPIP